MSSMTNAERQKAYRERCKENGKRAPSGKSGKSPRKKLPFITIDGEALGKHGYHLLAASTGDEVSNLTPAGLSSKDCLRFLLNLKKKHGSAIYCGFSLGYDCEHWIRDFGPSLWQSFREKGEGMVRLDGWTYTIQYIPKKWFKIGGYKNGRFCPKIAIFDVFSFFQASFEDVVGHSKKGWGAATEEEMAVLKEWKEKRGEFAAADWEAIKAYNQIECKVLIRLMEKLRDALEGAGVYLSSWHGPGAVANYLLKKHQMKEHIVNPPEGVEDAVARSYVGGRFECQQLGHFTGVYDYDISSAYPYATTLLPSTRGRWERVSEYQGDAALWTVYQVSWKVKGGYGSLKPFPWRDKDGGIHYPSYGRGWYWAWELAAARQKKEWRENIVIEDGWRLYPEEEGVFGWLREMAEKRVEAKGKADDETLSKEERERWRAIERGYKLALNSVYGKTIQTVGQHRPFLCPMWAALITSHTRSQILLAALRTPKKALICTATDGLFASAPVAGMPSKSDKEPELGDWELKTDTMRLEIYQSGCYAIYNPDGSLNSCRFRGVARKDIPWEKFRAEWKKNGLFGRVKVKTERFYGHRTALARNKPELQCQWVEVTKDVDLHPGGNIPFQFMNKGETAVWEAMWPGMDYNEISTRYRKLPPGEMEDAIDEQDVQPD